MCTVCCSRWRTPLAPIRWQMEEFPDEIYFRLMSRLEKRKFYLREAANLFHVSYKEWVHTYIRYDLRGRQQFFRITERLCPDCSSHYESSEEETSSGSYTNTPDYSSASDEPASDSE